MSQQDEIKQLQGQLVELQSQLAFQEDTLQALDDVVTQQQQQIDRLTAHSQQLKSQLERAINTLEGGELIDVPPPHY